MDEELVRAIGDELHAALRSRLTLQPLSERLPGLTIASAYRISRRLLERRLADGERVIGKKIGVTSRPVQELLNVHQPDFGFLTDSMAHPNGAVISLQQSGLIQPRAEGEIAFILSEDLCGPNVTAEHVLSATEAVVPCIEIVDSRIRNWAIRIEDTIADNASCGVFITGEARAHARAFDLATTEIKLYRNRRLMGRGLGLAVQGHPAAAVAWLANTLARFGIPLCKGEIILSGSPVALIPVRPRDAFELSVDSIGGASVRFVV